MLAESAMTETIPVFCRFSCRPGRLAGNALCNQSGHVNASGFFVAGLPPASWPIFEDFDSDKLVKIAQDCQKLLHRDGGLQKVIEVARDAVPLHLHDTAYAAAFEVAAVDLEMRMEELRVLQLLRRELAVDPLTVAAIERANKARGRSLT